MEAMAAAVEGAAVLVYGISRAYKESANCRLEAQYAYQREKPMVPLMLEEGYRADGWLGMLLGVLRDYAFTGPRQQRRTRLGRSAYAPLPPDLLLRCVRN